MIYKILNNNTYIDTDKLKDINIGYIKNYQDKEVKTLKNIIDKRLSKYKKRYSEDLKIKFKKIENEYDLWLNKIVNYLESIDNLSKENIFVLHKLFYPKDIWGESMNSAGERFYVNYKAGIFREREEYVIVDNIKYLYIDPLYINESIENLINYFNEDKETDIFKKIIIFYIYFCEIHSFYNGNGSMALFLGDYFLYKNNLDFSISDFLEKLTIQEKLSFFKSGFNGEYSKSFDIIKNKTMI